MEKLAWIGQGGCLRPGKAFIELKVHACNRTPSMLTFLVVGECRDPRS